MTHLLLTFVVLVLAGLGMALGVLLKGRPLPQGCGGPREGGCGPCERPRRADGCEAAGACPGGKERT